MPIKFKIALYNTVLVGIIMILVLIFMMSISNSVVESSTVNQLKFVLHDNAREVEWDDGEWELDDVSFYENYISTLIFDEKGVLLAGSVPNLSEFDLPFAPGEISQKIVGDETYLIYDLMVDEGRRGAVYLRGVVPVAALGDTVELLFSLTILSLPIFILCAGLGSYWIVKKSMKPLVKIVQTAEEISHGNDLSRRIDLGDGNDEIFQLAHTFDSMFSKLEQAFLSEKQFSSDISHELRTPIAVILAQCECMLSGEATAEEQLSAYEVIQRQGKKMQQLIFALLNLIRMDNGIHKLELEPVDVGELIHMVCEEQEGLLSQGKDIHLETIEGIFYPMDCNLMIRVLSNLIENGLKYGKNGGFVRVFLLDQPKFIEIRVEDDGIGISEADLPFIFKRFYQVDRARNQQSGNMGLGLAMVEQMVRLHQGEISVESTLGVGTCFFLKFPKEKTEI